jgi:hypothetical protein
MNLVVRFAALVLVAALVPGCATIQELRALRSVTFAYDRVTDVRLAGVRLHENMKFSSLSTADVARLIAAAGSDDLPLELVVHVRAHNPRANAVTARLVGMDWRFFIADRSIVNGALAGTYRFEPGEDVDIPVPVALDLAEHFRGGGRELFDVALEVAGLTERKRELRLELEPTIQTGIGPIRYPAPIVVRRPGN